MKGCDTASQTAKRPSDRISQEGFQLRQRTVNFEGSPVKRFLEILTNVRIATGEIGVTVTLLLLVAYGIYEAWQTFIAKLRK
jgi:hypothetical protein